MKKHKTLLFVCTGNTCRSPMAEYLLRYELKHRRIRWWNVSSCGIEVGEDNHANPLAVDALKEFGIDCSDFVPTQLTQSAIEQAQVVICMTQSQKNLLESCGNVICINDVCGFEISDPYGQGIESYRTVRDQLYAACEDIVNKIILSEDTL